MTPRYRLDELGWYQFEWLAQSLLKAAAGLSVESWGGTSGDNGKDAYSKGPLSFPSKDAAETGPFVFQAKYVEGANAASANWRTPLLAAVSRECHRIQDRRKRFRSWKKVGVYVLITNAPVSADVREAAGLAIAAELGADVAVHVFGANDVCDLLDQYPNVRKAFPQLLGLRDLEHLLEQAISRDVFAKSRVAISLAAEFSPVFVPTAAYEQAFTVLTKHNFVVLEGPPEMGKTAIAWMISLVQLSFGWQIIVCDDPHDIFKLHDPTLQQVFVADDAFGTTEYDATRSREWERQLERVLALLDASHWLLWTTRKHILERAKRDLDLRGKAACFPNPADVLVDASYLTLPEKALILYRHAKAAHPDAHEVDFVRLFAKAVVVHPAFTPERIRRFVHEQMPELSQALSQGRLTPERVSAEVVEAIRNPSLRMKKTYGTLSAVHKWLLVSLLECESGAWLHNVQQTLERHSQVPAGRSFRDLVDELGEAFVRLRTSGTHEWLAWMHPSYRDLVIEELSTDESMREAFLTSAWIPGIKLALSTAGGLSGERVRPLVKADSDWRLARTRVSEIAASGSPTEACELLETIAAALDDSTDLTISQQLLQMLSDACRMAREHWNTTGAVLTADDLAAYSRASVRVTPMPPLPALDSSWNNASERFGAELEHDSYELDADVLDEWSKFIAVVQQNEPRYLVRRSFTDVLVQIEDRLARRLAEELASSSSYDSPAEMRSEADRLRLLADTATRMVTLGTESSDTFRDLATRLGVRAERLDDRANEEDSEPEDDHEAYRRQETNSFDIDALFRDL